MKTRVIAAAVALPLFLIVLLVPTTLPTAIFFALVCAIGAWELLSATKLVKNPRLVIYAMLSAAGVSFWSWAGGTPWVGLCLCFVLFLALAAELLAAHTNLKFHQICYTVFGGLILPLLLTSLVHIRCMDNGAYLILMPLVIAFSADSGAYFAGRAFGKHKLAPIVSPKKTVEGAAGGVICAVVLVIVYQLILHIAFDFRVNYLAGALYAVLGSVVSIVGDLFFSVIKRQIGIKDFGNILPGHGGILDRFDSMITVAPLVQILIAVLPFAIK